MEHSYIPSVPFVTKPSKKYPEFHGRCFGQNYFYLIRTCKKIFLKGDLLYNFYSIYNRKINFENRV